MDTMHIVLSVIEVLACLFLIVTILLQEAPLPAARTPSSAPKRVTACRAF